MLREFNDQMHRTLEIQYPPKRIISLVPSQTEFLYDLGLKDEVVGQTLFCIHPKWAHLQKPRVGGTKKLNMEAIAALQPDLIIGNKEENDQTQIEALMKHYPVWMSDIKNLDDSLSMIKQIGDLVNKEAIAIEMAFRIESSFKLLNKSKANKKVGYFIWRDPWMAAGNNTFIDDMLQRCGFTNAFANLDSRYPEISHLQLQTSHLDMILLSSEPYPFKEKHIAELQEIFPLAQIKLVDGELFSWYGSRLMKSARYFETLLG